MCVKMPLEAFVEGVAAGELSLGGSLEYSEPQTLGPLLKQEQN